MIFNAHFSRLKTPVISTDKWSWQIVLLPTKGNSDGNVNEFHSDRFPSFTLVWRNSIVWWKLELRGNIQDSREDNVFISRISRRIRKNIHIITDWYALNERFSIYTSILSIEIKPTWYVFLSELLFVRWIMYTRREVFPFVIVFTI